MSDTTTADSNQATMQLFSNLSSCSSILIKQAALELGLPDPDTIADDFSPEQARTMLGRLSKRASFLKAALDQSTLDKALSRVDVNPSDAQREANNARKGHITWKGLRITIENPKGSIRKGKGKDGTPWERKMAASYGYVKSTCGKDGDHVDVYLGDNLDSDVIFVVNQLKESGRFDEHKCILGCSSEKEAKELYLAHYPSNWKCGPVTAMTIKQFKRWLDKGDMSKQADDPSSGLLSLLGYMTQPREGYDRKRVVSAL